MRIVLGWSAFTALTGAAWNFTSMVVIRFLFGIGEAGCFPIIAKSLATWLPRSERTRAQGLLWMAARWGGAFTPLLVVWVLQFVNWRMAFVLFGLLGIVWAVFFYRWYRDDPREHPAVNPAELALMRDIEPAAMGEHGVPWGRLLRSRAVLLLTAQYYFLSFGWYFSLTWLPTYLQEHHKLTPAQSRRLRGDSRCSSTASARSSAAWSRPRSPGSPATTRGLGELMAVTGFLGAGGFLMLATRMPGINLTMAMMAIACFCNDLVMPHAWASCMDVGGRYASSVAGTMNLMGNLAGASSTMIGGFLLSQAGRRLEPVHHPAGPGLLPRRAVLAAARSADLDRHVQGAARRTRRADARLSATAPAAARPGRGVRCQSCRARLLVAGGEGDAPSAPAQRDPAGQPCGRDRCRAVRRRRARGPVGAAAVSAARLPRRRLHPLQGDVHERAPRGQRHGLGHRLPVRGNQSADPAGRTDQDAGQQGARAASRTTGWCASPIRRCSPARSRWPPTSARRSSTTPR